MNPSPLSIAAFLKRHWPSCRHWPRHILLPWIDWYGRDAKIAFSRCNGKLVAVGLARVLNHLTQFSDHYAHDETGSILWIDLAVAAHPLALRALWRALPFRFGKKPFIAFERNSPSRPSRLCFYSFSRMDRLLRQRSASSPSSTDHNP